MKVLGFVFGKKALSRKGKLKPGTHNNGQMEKKHNDTKKKYEGWCHDFRDLLSGF